MFKFALEVMRFCLANASCFCDKVLSDKTQDDATEKKETSDNIKKILLNVQVCVVLWGL